MWFSKRHFPKLRLSGRHIYLRPPRLGDYPQWKAVRGENRHYLQPWEPKWTPNALTLKGFRARLRYLGQKWREKTGYTFLIFLKGTDELIGGININNVTAGVSQMGSLGYWTAKAHTGQGYMTEAIGLVTRHAFSSLGLHRVEAACLPDNTASRRVLEKCGFTEEGYVRKYIKINGKWQDHVLYGLVEEDLAAASAPVGAALA